MLKKGDRLPDIKLKNEEDEWVSLIELAGNKPLVIFFYPKDNTSVCTAQACGFRDSYEEFKAAGARVVGISKDSPESHRKVSSKRQLPYPLLSDPDRKALRAFKVPSGLLGLLPARVTFVIDEDGIIVYSFRADFHADKHVQEALKVVNKLSN